MDRKEAMQCFQAFSIYGITAEAMSNGRSNLEVVEEMLKAGIRFVQYREKEKSGLDRYNECLQLRKLTNKYGAAFIIDDFVDLAIAVAADGVHIGQEDLPPQVVRQLLGPDKVIGLSTHSPEQLDRANAISDIIDYIGVGPVFATNTKKTAVPVGFEYVKYAVANAKMPFVAIGGIKDSNIADVKRAGAKVVSVVTGITMAEDIGLMVNTLNNNMK